MADFWIKIEKGTPDKPEILELAALLDIEDPDTITGKMIRVWSWFDSNSENGHAPLVTKVLIDRLTGVTGFTDSLLKVGWLEKTEEGYCVPKFNRHLGKGAKKRASDAERQRKSREKSQQCNNNITTMSQKKCDKSVTKKGLDKSRVDKSRVDTNSKRSMSSKLDLVQDIFAHWCKVMDKPVNTTKLTPKRQQKIQDRLDQGYTPDDIKRAIDGCRDDPFSMGQNDRCKKYNDIELICRNGEKLEFFMETVDATIQPQLSTAQKMAAEFEQKYGAPPAPIDFSFLRLAEDG